MRDEVVGAEEDVQLARDELIGGRVEAHAVDDQIDVSLVIVQLRMVDFGQGVFDGQRVEVERVLEDRRLVDRRVLEIDPMQRPLRGTAQAIGREFVLALDVSADAPEVGQQERRARLTAACRGG
jgi:hypothetical protein